MRKTVLTLVAATLVSATATSAQTGSASIHVPTLLTLDVTNTTVTFADPTFTDFDAGLIAAQGTGSVISTRGNVPHLVQITADAATMTYAGTDAPPAAKSASDLEWSADNGTTWAGLATMATNVATYTRGSHTSATTVLYRMLLNVANDFPGDYSLGFTYTITAN